jgi:starvation-inducible DNA-binding protein
MSDVTTKLSVLLADTYALYLKTQNYHWHVTGPHFGPLHALFEGQYTELAEAIDEIAERIRTLDAIAPATFSDLNELKTLKDGNAKLEAQSMVTELEEDNRVLVADLNRLLELAGEAQDEGTATLVGDRIAVHEKAAWMLRSSL